MADPAALVADGKATSTVTLTLRDSNDNPVTGQTVAFASSLGKVGTATEGSGGVYTATLTAGTLAGTAAISTTVGGTALAVKASVTFSGNSSDLSTTKSTLVADPTALVADGKATSTVTLTLRDSNDNPVTGQTVAFASSLGQVDKVTEGSGGVYTATLTAGTKAGTAAISTTVGGTALSVNASVTFSGNSSDLSTTKSTLVADPIALVADGKATSTLTLTLRDSNDNPVTGQTVVFTSNLGEVGTVTEGSGGVYTATLTAGTLAGTAAISTTVGGTALAVNANVTFSGNSSDLSPTKSSLVAAPTTLVADGKATSTVTLTLRDSNDNTVTGQTVVFTSNLGEVGTVTEGSGGVYTATLTAGTLAGTAAISTTVGGTALAVNANVTFSGNSSDLSTTKSTLVADPTALVADGKATSTVTLTLRDSNDNTVTGQTVAFTSNLGEVGTVTEGSGGVYTATLTAGIVAGTASITTTVGGTALAVNASVTFSGNSSDLSTTKSTLVADPTALVADGKATSTVTLTLRDSNDNPVTGQTVAFTSSLGKVSAVTEGSGGVYTATLTAGTLAGTAAISTTVGGNALAVNANVTFSGNSSDLSTTKSTLVAAPAALVADGKATSTVTLTLRDSNDNPVTGQTVAFASSLGQVDKVTEGSGGVYTATLTAGTLAGTAAISTTVGGTALAVNANVTFSGNSSDLSTTKSTLVADPAALVADGKATSTVTLTLRDSNDNPVTGQTVAFASSLGQVDKVTEGSGGVYTATLTAGTKAGTAAISVTVGGNALAVNANVTFSGNSSDLSTTKSTLVADPAALVADGKTTSTVTLTLRDSNDNPVTGQTVAFASNLGKVGTVTEGSGGVYTATLTAGIVAGTASITTTVAGKALGVTASVSLNGNSNDLSTTKSTLVAAQTEVVADGSSTSLITLTLKDSNNNLVTGQTVLFTSSLGKVGSATESNGVYTATLTSGIVAGSATVGVTVGGKAFTITVKVTLIGNSNDLGTNTSMFTTNAPKILVVSGANASDIVGNTPNVAKITLTLRDSNKNPIANQTVVFNNSLGSMSKVTGDSNGIYTAELRGSSSGTARVTVTVGGKSFGISPLNISVVAAALMPVQSGSTWSFSGNNRIVDVVETLKYISIDEMNSLPSTLRFVGFSIYCGSGAVYPAGNSTMDDYTDVGAGKTADQGITAYINAKFGAGATVGRSRVKSFTWSATQCPSPDRVEFGTAQASKAADPLYPNGGSYRLSYK